jgi:hypothetical protein
LILEANVRQNLRLDFHIISDNIVGVMKPDLNEQYELYIYKTLFDGASLAIVVRDVWIE